MFNSSARAKRRGQSMVEFALILPILLILVAGGADLGRALFVGIQITDAARQASLYAAGNPTSYTQPELKAIAEGGAGSGALVCPAGQLHLSLGPTSDVTGGGSLQPVTVTCDLPMLTPGIPSPVKLTATATVLILP